MIKFLATLSLTFACSQAQAHLLKVFAFTLPADSNSQLVKGKVYFTGGQTVSGALVTIFNTSGIKVKNTMTDTEGKFQITLAQESYEIVADTQDGHKATWQIKSAKISTSDSTEKNVLAASNPSIEQLESIIAAQISTQLTPLTEQIIQLQEKRRFQDIIGAIGYIVGLSGLFLWFRQRQTQKDISS